MKSAEIRSAFLEFFAARGHRVVPSSSLVPANDPSLLFTNAGMVQFKDVFTGREQRAYTRAASAQRCVRAGGKHNDLENVGYTARHHTLFEMLGNFSFGDYFKRDAIAWAWELLTGTFGLPPERLWVTVHESDDDAARIWLEDIGVDPGRFTRMGDAENFWAMGDTGPCGPCSEVFYDHGPDVPGGPPGSSDEDGDRYVEIWNLVFMQYERDAQARLSELPRPCVDTGMGLERMAAVLQGVHSNYDIDLFRHLIEAAARETGLLERDAPGMASLRVIADHIRSTAFLIADGVLPSNEDRGYVLRRIIRRALRHGYKLGVERAFFHRLVDPLVAEMGGAYPELARNAEHVKRVLEQEEAQFARTLRDGMELLERELARLEGETVPGEVVFRLYDTYGFPADLTADVARERGLQVDHAGFEAHMEAQRERARAASRFGNAEVIELDLEGRTDFSGYERLEDTSRVVTLMRQRDDAGEPERVDALETGETGIVVLDRTPFYAEAGGQVGDTGELAGDGCAFRVTDTTPGGEQHLHHGRVERGGLAAGDRVGAHVDAERRRCIALNHSATHLLHAALKQVLGAHVEQKGSLVAPDRLRFDFAHYQPLGAGERAEIERLVNEQIWHNTAVETAVMSYDEAMSQGAVALFGEKYGERVRVLKMGDDDFSVELCGGTHVQRTGDIGFFRIISEAGVAAGVRRLEAVTGPGAMRWLDAADATLERLGEILRTSRDDLERKAAALVEENRELGKHVEQLEARLAAARGGELEDRVEEVAGVRVLASEVEGVDPKGLLSTLDTLKNRLAPAVIVLATVSGGKVHLIAGVTKDLTDRLAAGDLVRTVAEQVGAKGGGRPDMARAGGGDRPDALPDALGSVRDWVAARLG